jgi:hypothetical protein
MKTLVCGFNDVQSNETPTGKLAWYCSPTSWKEDLIEGRREGRDGKWNVNEQNQLVLHTPAKKDFWRKTYYEPIHVEDDGSMLHCTHLPLSEQYTVEKSFYGRQRDSLTRPACVYESAPNTGSRPALR